MRSKFITCSIAPFFLLSVYLSFFFPEKKKQVCIDSSKIYIKMNKIHSEQQSTSDNMVRKKRARATAEQLSVLEGVFAMNISPNGKVRKQLSQQLNMTERSVQIWFQNKRAKIKNLQKKAHTQGFYGSPYENRPFYSLHMPPNQFHRYHQENFTNRFPPNMLQRPLLSNNFLNDPQCNRTIPGKHINHLPSSLSPPPDESLRHNFSSQYLPHKQRSSSILETKHSHELDIPSLKNDMLSGKYIKKKSLY